METPLPPVSTITICLSTLTFLADMPGIYKDADWLSLFAIGEATRDRSIRVIVTFYYKSLSLIVYSGDVVSLISEEGMGSQFSNGKLHFCALENCIH